MEQALAWLSRWGVSLASLGGGLLTLLVFRRGLPNVGWIVGYLLLLWLLFAVFIEMRQALAGSEQKSRRLIVSAVDYTIQTLYHGLLLRSEEHTSELQSHSDLVCRLLLEKKKNYI